MGLLLTTHPMARSFGTPNPEILQLWKYCCHEKKWPLEIKGKCWGISMFGRGFGDISPAFAVTQQDNYSPAQTPAPSLCDASLLLWWASLSLSRCSPSACCLFLAAWIYRFSSRTPGGQHLQDMISPIKVNFSAADEHTGWCSEAGWFVYEYKSSAQPSDSTETNLARQSHLCHKWNANTKIQTTTCQVKKCC